MRYIITYQLSDVNRPWNAYTFTTVTRNKPLFWYDNRLWMVDREPTYHHMVCIILMIYEVKE